MSEKQAGSILSRNQGFALRDKQTLRALIKQIYADTDASVAGSLTDPTIVGDVIRTVTEGEGELIGADYGWRDILGEVVTKGAGATTPTFTQIDATAFWAYKFDLNDEIWMVYHIPHDYVPGTDIHFHVHWIPDGTDANPVKWQWEIAHANGYGTAQFDLASPDTITAEGTPLGTAYTHEITETAAYTPTGLEVDGLICVNITRIANGATDNTDGIHVLTADVHYQSTGLATKNKNAPFYT